MTRVVGQTKDAGFQIGVSRTLSSPPDVVWRFLTEAEGLALWLGDEVRLEPTRGAPYTTADGTTGEVRGYQDTARIRLTHRPAGADAETTVQVTVSASGAGTVLRFHQERLANSAAREDRRRHWQAVMDEVVDALAAKS
jgi:uncharacterized protein YndB with AHSA1/START domain